MIPSCCPPPRWPGRPTPTMLTLALLSLGVISAASFADAKSMPASQPDPADSKTPAPHSVFDFIAPLRLTPLRPPTLTAEREKQPGAASEVGTPEVLIQKLPLDVTKPAPTEYTKPSPAAGESERGRAVAEEGGGAEAESREPVHPASAELPDEDQPPSSVAPSAARTEVRSESASSPPSDDAVSEAAPSTGATWIAYWRALVTVAVLGLGIAIVLGHRQLTRRIDRHRLRGRHRARPIRHPHPSGAREPTPTAVPPDTGRADPEDRPEPSELAQRIATNLNSLHPVRTVRVPRGTWAPVAAMHTGPVRPNQEDYALVLIVDGEDEGGPFIVAIEADGLGGGHSGEIASYLGATAAAASAARAVAFATENDELDLEAIARQAVCDAETCLAVEAARRGQRVGRGFRTTLLVTVAAPARFGFASLGDGAGWIVDPATCAVEPFFVPAKGPANHIVTSSLGPFIDGQIQSGTLERSARQWLILTSDGIADNIKAGARQQFVAQLISAAYRYHGNLQAAASRMLQTMSEYRDSRGAATFDDNISIAILTDGAAPAPEAGQPPAASEVATT